MQHHIMMPHHILTPPLPSPPDLVAELLERISDRAEEDVWHPDAKNAREQYGKPLENDLEHGSSFLATNKRRGDV